MLLLELTQSIVIFPFYVPRQYVLNASKQFLNHFNSEYEMFWETFCNSEMVTKKFLSTKEAIKGTHARTHIHSRNCSLHVTQKHSIRKANTTMYKEREL